MAVVSMWKRAKKPGKPGVKRRLRRCALFLLLPFGALLWLYVSVGSEVHLTTPTPTTLFEDRHGAFLAESESGPLGFWEPMGESRVAAAILAVEDHRFHHHPGVDPYAMVRALINNLGGNPREGGSTIAMQVARMQRPAPRSYARKVREMMIASRLTWRYGRERVLRHYLTIVPMGSRVHGVAYASRRYFRKPLADLTWAEAALLAALPKAPGDMNLYRRLGRHKAIERADLILGLLHKRGHLDTHALQLARDQLSHLVLPRKEVRPFHSMHAILRLEQMTDSASVGAEQRPRRTTLDLGLQADVDRMAHETIRHLRGQGAGNIAVVVMDHTNGDMLAYLGSDFYADAGHAGAIDYARVPRSAGSTLKPFLFALGMERGFFSPASILPDLPMHITFENGHYAPGNYDSGYLGPMLYRRALANSRNIPAILVLRDVGVQHSFDHLRALGLSDPRRGSDHYGLGLAIGGLYVALEDLTAAYGSFANGGFRFQPRWFSDQEGGALAQRIYSETTARRMARILSDPQARLPSFPRGSAMDSLVPIALKTGTSQGYRDAWCVGFSARYLTGVWIGRPDHGRTNAINGSQAARLAVRILEHLHPEAVKGVGESPFPSPRETVAVKLCSLDGKLAGSLCSAPVLEDLLPAEVPAQTSTAHIQRIVDQRTGELATDQTPSSFRVVRTYAQLPPIYRAWLQQKGWLLPGSSTAMARASVRVAAPADGARYMIDPSTPRTFQTLALRAEVVPNVPEIRWFINDQPIGIAKDGKPYRWRLEPGIHRIQAGFPRANLRSEPITITVVDPQQERGPTGAR